MAWTDRPVSRVPEPAELADDISEIKGQLASLLDKLDKSYVPRELYEARHMALRNEIALEFAGMKAEMDANKASAANDTASTRGIADSARTLSLWCLGIFATAVIGAFVGFIASGGIA